MPKATKTQANQTGQKKAEDWKLTFIKELENGSSVTAAAYNKKRSTIYNERAKDKDFAKAWDDAVRTWLKKRQVRVENVLIEAVELGPKIPIYDDKGVLQGHKRGPQSMRAATLLLSQGKCGDEAPVEPIDLGDLSTLQGVAKAEILVMEQFAGGRLGQNRHDTIIKALQQRRDTIYACDVQANVQELRAPAKADE